jgi:hypothetical protein
MAYDFNLTIWGVTEMKVLQNRTSVTIAFGVHILSKGGKIRYPHSNMTYFAIVDIYINLG